MKAPVKINLHLGIHPGVDAQGYHQADSLMAALALGDRVSVTLRLRSMLTERIAFTISERVTGVPQKNTAYIAAERFFEAFDQEFELEKYGVEINIIKSVKPKSGLGGSSSDAATVLRGLCSFCGVDVQDERVYKIAQSIGADVPFFLNPKPTLLTGRGDVVSEVFEHVGRIPVALVRPAYGVATADAYAAYDKDPIEPISPHALVEALHAHDQKAIANSLYNNLEPAACAIVPRSGAVKTFLLAQHGVLGAQVTGSGSCVFAICKTSVVAQRVAEEAQRTYGYWTAATHTI